MGEQWWFLLYPSCGSRRLLKDQGKVWTTAEQRSDANSKTPALMKECMIWWEIPYRTVFASRTFLSHLEVLDRCCLASDSLFHGSSCANSYCLYLSLQSGIYFQLSSACGKATGTMLRDSNQYTAVLLKHHWYQKQISIWIFDSLLHLQYHIPPLLLPLLTPWQHTLPLVSPGRNQDV